MRTTVRHAHKAIRVDTDKLHLIAADGYGDGSNFDWWEETLYRGKTYWVLVGKGGARSEYGERCGNGYGCGEGVTVLTEDQAIDWLLMHDPEIAAVQFPDLAEDA